ncbi:PD-(D/E)XK nuclease family transposase, partial [Bacillus thuringiensis]|uniref:PD-(D/E)XK nuclease family transposase n=1 Tax=Bacillus thuringiensis TaxID=1428 RepID=UPI001642ADC1
MKNTSLKLYLYILHTSLNSIYLYPSNNLHSQTHSFHLLSFFSTTFHIIHLTNPNNPPIHITNPLNLPIHFPFKQLFPTKPNQNILIPFLNPLFHNTFPSPITTFTLQHPHLHKQYKHHKLSIIHVPPT